MCFRNISMMGLVSALAALVALGACELDRPGVNLDGTDEPDGSMTEDGFDGDAGDDVETYRRSIAITPPALSRDVLDFPVAVVIAEDAELAAAAQPDGRDIVFTSEAGALLSHEIEAFDPATGALVAWVRVPVIARVGTTAISMYYGDDAATSREDRAGTWSSMFTGVWHLDPRPVDGDTVEFLDSTARGNHGDSTGDQRPGEVMGIAGPGQQFAPSQVIWFRDPDDGSLDHGTASFSYSAWVRVTASAGSRDLPWYKGGFDPDTDGYQLALGTGAWTAQISDGDRAISASFGDESAMLDRWVYLAATFDAGQAQLSAYRDGALTGTGSGSPFGSISTDHWARIGDTVNPFNGAVDEMRVYNTAVSADWIALEFANLSDPASFLAIGPAQPAPYPALP